MLLKFTEDIPNYTSDITAVAGGPTPSGWHWGLSCKNLFCKYLVSTLQDIFTMPNSAFLNQTCKFARPIQYKILTFHGTHKNISAARKFLIYVHLYMYLSCKSSTSHFLPEASIGLRVLSLPASVSVCVCPSVRQSRACPRDNSWPVSARITKFGP